MKLSLDFAKFAAATLCATTLLGAGAQAQISTMSLTAYGMSKGFTLGPWASGFTPTAPDNTGIGPIGVLARVDGKVLVTNYSDSKVYRYALNTPIGDSTGQRFPSGATLTADYGGASHISGQATGLAARVTASGTRYFMTQQGTTPTNGKVIEINADGVYVQDIAALPGATGICPFPKGAFFMGTASHLGHLFVTATGGIWEVDPDLPGAAPTLFLGVAADGIAFTNSGHYLMTNAFAVYDMLSGSLVMSVPISGGDGIAIGRGPLTGGRAYINTNFGKVVEVVYDESPGVGLEIDPASPVTVNDICSGGSRGDFISVDIDRLSGGPTLYWPSLLITQTDRILRIDPPDCGFFGPPFEIDNGGGANGVQTLCEPGVNGALACPCGNPSGTPGRGCNNSSNTGGARVDWNGVPSLAADTLQFVTDGEKPVATSIVLQGNALIASGQVFGQGVRCVAGSLKRLYVKNAVAGSIQAPSGADPSVSARSAALGDVLFPGAVRHYTVYYRDPTVLGGCAAASTFNTTETLSASWGP